MQSSRLLTVTRTGVFKNLLGCQKTVQQQRMFSLSTSCREEEKTPETTEEAVVEEEAEPIKMSRRRRRFHDWVNGAGAKYSRPSKGTTNYLGSSTPFPNNPLFSPRPPLSDARRQEIYDAFISDPEKHSIRKLATQYGISLKRVEAILKLKTSEKEMEENGVQLQKKFTKGMEQLMGVDQTVELLKEPLIDIFPAVGKPKFKTLSEDANFGPTEAADVLGRIPFKDLERRVIESEQAEFVLSKPETNKKSTGKKFVIVDTSA